MPTPNNQIGPYTLIRQLGKGAFGVTWLAESRSSSEKSPVAVKLPFDDSPELAAIAQESELWRALGNHPNLLPIKEAKQYDGQLVIVSEYAPDRDLDGWLKAQPRAVASIESALAITSGILSGLEYLHSKQILHRDLKPTNILLQGETPRLADWGLIKVLKTSSHSAPIAGTAAFMAPEVFSGQRSEQSDLWAVGVILYQLLTGRLPFPQTDIMALIGAIGQNDPEPLPATIPEGLQQIVTKALKKDPTERFSSATEMKLALQTGMVKLTKLTSPTPNSRPATVSAEKNNATGGRKKSHRVLYLSIAALLVLSFVTYNINQFRSKASIRNRVVASAMEERSFDFDTVFLDLHGNIKSHRSGQAQYYSENLGAVSLDMVKIPGGSFFMGSPFDSSESPQHLVNLPTFYIGKFEVTQAQWQAVMEDNIFFGNDLPIERVSWKDAMRFCQRLSEKTGRDYRLPSESEWEYACRAGTTTQFAFGDSVNPEIVNYHGDFPFGVTPKGLNRNKSTPVGAMGEANAFGLYDMQGNVLEWCLDRWHEDYQGAPTDGSAWENGGDSERVLRGGCWHYLAAACRSAYRYRNHPDSRNVFTGFRVVMVESKN